jgi:hypothetical protein
MAGQVDLAKLVVRMEAQSAQYLKDLEKQKKATKKWQSKVSGNVGTVSKAFKGLAAAAGIAVLTKKIIDNTRKQEQAVAQLGAGFKSVGGVVGQSVDGMIKKAGELQKVSIFGDEQIIEAQSQLVTFTQITGQEFDRVTVAAMDLSTRMGTDLKSSVIQLGKALNDPILGLSALSRSGIQFDENQKDLIKTLVESGDTIGAQKIILKELETQFGGSAKAARETFGGALSGLGGAFNDLLEGGGDGGGLEGALLAIEDLTTMLQDPSFVANTNTFLSAAITGFTKLASLVAMVVEGWAKIGDWVITPEARQWLAALAENSPPTGEPLTVKQRWDNAKAKNRAPAVASQAAAMPVVATEAVLSKNELDNKAWSDKLSYEPAQAKSDYDTESQEWQTKLYLEQLEAKAEYDKKYADKEMRLAQDVHNMKFGLAASALGLIASTAKEGSAIQRAALIASKAMSIAQIIMQTEVAAISALALPPIGLGPVAGLGMSGMIRSMGYASAALVGAQAVASFDGGGYTGDGPRSGGLDGKGGFMAMMHPQETVTDHTRGGGGTTINKYDFRGSELSESRVRAMIDKSNMVQEARLQNRQSRGR